MSEIDIAIGMIQLVSVVLSIWVSGTAYYLKHQDGLFERVTPDMALTYTMAIFMTLFGTYTLAILSLKEFVGLFLLGTFHFFGAFLCFLSTPVPHIVSSTGKGKNRVTQFIGRLSSVLLAVSGIYLALTGVWLLMIGS